MLPISACIIAKNQAHRIRLALDSLDWCAQIVVVDSGSTDGTMAICNNHPSGKVHAVYEPFRGYNQQRQFAASLCPTEWVLLLDADEEVSDGLRQEIQKLTPDRLEKAAIFEMPRKNYIRRRYIRCWSPDYQTRLIHKNRTLWGEQSAPEIRTPKYGFTQHKLKHPLLHNRLTPFTPADFCDGPRMQEHATILANAMQARGKRATLLHLLTRPPLTFLKYYILKGAFLDGRFGLVIAYKSTVGATLKYSVLYGRELQNEPPTSAP
ncbi:MAG TPA: glycosyltransferase family 2 protein [Phycisphaerae bacterium]|nr:glycosyltransferase family 2 protein [Phycisphaerae bacterium]